MLDDNPSSLHARSNSPVAMSIFFFTCYIIVLMLCTRFSCVSIYYITNAKTYRHQAKPNEDCQLGRACTKERRTHKKIGRAV